MIKTYALSQIVQNAKVIENEHFDETLKIGGKRSSFRAYPKNVLNVIYAAAI
jgi:hypothetical protein